MRKKIFIKHLQSVNGHDNIISKKSENGHHKGDYNNGSRTKN
jgi:hypothetical protein